MQTAPARSLPSRRQRGISRYASATFPCESPSRCRVPHAIATYARGLIKRMVCYREHLHHAKDAPDEQKQLNESREDPDHARHTTTAVHENERAQRERLKSSFSTNRAKRTGCYGSECPAVECPTARILDSSPDTPTTAAALRAPREPTCAATRCNRYSSSSIASCGRESTPWRAPHTWRCRCTRSSSSCAYMKAFHRAYDVSSDTSINQASLPHLWQARHPPAPDARTSRIRVSEPSTTTRPLRC